MEIILSDVHCIQTLELSGKVVERKGGSKSIRYDKIPLFIFPIERAPRVILSMNSKSNIYRCNGNTFRAIFSETSVDVRYIAAGN